MHRGVLFDADELDFECLGSDRGASHNADVLRLYAPAITISDFALLAATLSPTVEFGKVPQSPLGQLVELVKTAKEAGK